MNDDLEPRLGDHLRHRASRVHVAPDLGDLHHRIDQRHQRRTRALGAALAIALVAGPVLGFALARASEPDRDNLAAVGGGGTSGDDEGRSTTDALMEGGGAVFDDPRLAFDPVSERTTEEGIRLVVHLAQVSDERGPCVVDGIVRVGIVGGDDLVDVVYIPTAQGGASFQVAGTTVGRPAWVVVTRDYEAVTAVFPNGRRDTVSSAPVQVLAAYADPGEPIEDLGNDSIEIDGVAPPASEHDIREVTLDDGAAGCTPDTPVPPVDLTMPEPGEPPADEAAARAEIEALFSGFGGRDPSVEVDRHERPNVWLDADARFRAQHPQYVEWAKEVESVPLEIVFTAPDRATVRYELVSDDPDIPAPGERIGEAVLIEGVWKVSIETTCGNLGLAGIECDYSIEG